MWWLVPVLALADSTIEVVSFAPDASRVRVHVTEDDYDRDLGEGAPPVTRIDRTEWWSTGPWDRIAFEESRTDTDPETGESTVTTSSDGDPASLEDPSAPWTNAPPKRYTGPLPYQGTWDLQARVGESEWPLATTAEHDDRGISWTVPGTSYVAINDADGNELDPESYLTGDVTLWLVGPTEVALSTVELPAQPSAFNRTGRVDAWFDPEETWVLLAITKGGPWQGTEGTLEWYRLPLAIEVVRSSGADAAYADSIAARLTAAGHRVTRSETKNAHDQTKVFVAPALHSVGQEIALNVPGDVPIEDLTWATPAQVVVVVGPAPPATQAPVPAPAPEPVPAPLTTEPVPAPESDGTCLCSVAAVPVVGLPWVLLPLIRRRRTTGPPAT